MEFIPDKGRGVIEIPLLREANNFESDNYYPFVNLLPDGTLWIFANRDSIVYDYKRRMVVRMLPKIPDGPRSYPTSGSSVMLPLMSSDGFGTAEVLVCGGAQVGAFSNPWAQLGALQSCGRISVTSPPHTPPNNYFSWEMETMPYRRTMGDMVLLPTREVLIINGTQNGSQGWEFASNPVVYKPGHPKGERFVVQEPSRIPRMYHSTANLLPDGRVLIAGSNAHEFYTFTGEYPTELRVEAFSPDYLTSIATKNKSSNSNSKSFNSKFQRAGNRPVITKAPTQVPYGSTFTITFTLNSPPQTVEINIVSAPFVTHSYSQGQRLLVLQTSNPTSLPKLHTYQVNVSAPPNAMVAPPAYYMAFIVHMGIPSVAIWIQVVST